MVPGTEPEIPEVDVRAALEEILSAPDFETSDRNRRFLRHVVEEALAGRANRIKAYSIATTVFGRPDDFDPMQDSIVRIEAGRLRRALESHHLRHGEGGGVQISIPKGTYAPKFSRVAAREPEPPPTAAPVPRRSLHQYAPRLLVENLEQEAEADSPSHIGRVLTRQVILALTRFTEVFVYGFDTTEAHLRTEFMDDCERPLRIDYRLLGTVTLSNEVLRAELLLKRETDGRFLWAQVFERQRSKVGDPSDLVSLCAEIAGQAAGVVALRDGILDSQAREAVGDGPRHFIGYQKLLDFQDYWRSLDVTRFHPLRHDLEATIAEDPGFVDAHACLSMLYSNAARYDYDVSDRCTAPLERAMDLARRAVQLAPGSSRAYHARGIAEWFLGRTEESIATMQHAHALNPNDPEMLAELGFRHAMRMEWDSAVPLLREAYTRNPLQSGQYRMGLFLYHFAEGRPELALREIRAIEARDIAQVHLATAAVLSVLGRMEEARAALALTTRLAPRLHGRLREDLGFRQVHPKMVADILRAIERIDPGWTAAGPSVAGTRTRKGANSD